MTCNSCRARMCTDGVLSKLRCAECRQIEFERFYDVAAKLSLIALGGVLAWYFLRGLHTEEKAHALIRWAGYDNSVEMDIEPLREADAKARTVAA